MNSLRILLYGDFRSPHARGMLSGLTDMGAIVKAVSSETVMEKEVTSPADPISRLKSNTGTLGANLRAKKMSSSGGRKTVASSALMRKVQGNVAFIAALGRANSRINLLRDVAESFRPDVVHALRVPYEGVTAVTALHGRYPIVLSTWGSDFYYQGWDCPGARPLIRFSIERANGFHYDNPLDLLRAEMLGLNSTAERIFAAGNFGTPLGSEKGSVKRVRSHVVFGRGGHPIYRPELGVAVARLLISEGFLFTFVGCNNVPEVRKLGHEFSESVCLRERLSSGDYRKLLQEADFFLSTALSDGTPNSLIEASVAGSWVVAAELPQLRAVNSLISNLRLFPGTPEALAEGMKMLRQANRTDPVLAAPFDRFHNAARFEKFYADVLAS